MNPVEDRNEYDAAVINWLETDAGCYETTNKP